MSKAARRRVSRSSSGAGGRAEGADQGGRAAHGVTENRNMTDKSKNVSQPKDYKLIVEKDVKIPMRDGTLLYADVFRPDGGGERVPGDHEHRPLPEGQAVDAAATISRRKRIRYHELGDGESRCGGARAATRCVRVDARGSGKSPGQVRAELVPGSASTSTTRSSGSRSCRGARATSARSASRITPTPSGASPTSSRRR